MKIAMLQIQVQENIHANLHQVKTLAQTCHKNGAEILVLPEMWNCPYTNEQILKSVDYFDICKDLLQTLSSKLECLIVGGTIAHKIQDKIFNECLIFDHGKFVASYAKTHLFEVHTHKDYQEKDVFTPGDHLQVFDTQWGKMGILICYDIRFPEVTRLLALKGARVIFCPAAFNKSVTLQHWTPLFQVRAMENQVFMVGVNPAHYQYDSFESYGHSIITDPFGKICCQMDENKLYSITDIDLKRIEQIRDRMPFWKIRRKDLYSLKERKKMKEIQINDLQDFKIGHAQDETGGTGCTVILCEQGAVAGVDVRGGGPATRETDLLNPKNMVEQIHAVTLAGGSAFGLEASCGVMEYLSEHKIGFDMKGIYIPIVSGACLFDCSVADPKAYPTKQMGYQACQNASHKLSEQGCIGAGTGASVGKSLGFDKAMKSGLGHAAFQVQDVMVAAIVAVNACGDVYFENSEKPIAGIYDYQKKQRLSTLDFMFDNRPIEESCGMNTTIGCVLTNAKLTKAQANKIASMAHNGYARTIRPVHTSNDGDTIFTMASQKVEAQPDLVGALAAKAMAKAIENACIYATPMYGLTTYSQIHQ